MATHNHIRNPIEWSWDQIKSTTHAVGSAAHALDTALEEHEHAPPQVNRIGIDDLKDALRKGLEDFGAYRTDVIFACLIYPLIGLILSRLAWGHGMLPLVFPLVSGFALVGPVVAIGLYEMSRRHERGIETSWTDAFQVVRSPAFGAILVLGARCSRSSSSGSSPPMRSTTQPWDRCRRNPSRRSCATFSRPPPAGPWRASASSSASCSPLRSSS